MWTQSPSRAPTKYPNKIRVCHSTVGAASSSCWTSSGVKTSRSELSTLGGETAATGFFRMIPNRSARRKAVLRVFKSMTAVLGANPAFKRPRTKASISRAVTVLMGFRALSPRFSRNCLTVLAYRSKVVGAFLASTPLSQSFR